MFATANPYTAVHKCPLQNSHPKSEIQAHELTHLKHMTLAEIVAQAYPSAVKAE